MTSQMRGKGKQSHYKVLVRPLNVPSIFISLGIMAMPGFQFLFHRLAVFLFYNKRIPLNQATVNSIHFL